MSEEKDSRQLRLGGKGEIEEEVKKKRKRNKPRDRWVVLAVLVLSVLVSLGFYLMSNKQSQRSWSLKQKKSGGFFGEAVYEF